MLKEKLNTSNSPAIEKKCKWQTHYFSKSGKCYQGKNLWETEEKAQANLERIKRNIASNDYSKNDYILNFPSDPLSGEDLSWAIHIPILE